VSGAEERLFGSREISRVGINPSDLPARSMDRPYRLVLVAYLGSVFFFSPFFYPATEVVEISSKIARASKRQPDPRQEC